MSLIDGVREEDATGLVKDVFEEMKAVRGWDHIPPMWRVMAVNPPYLAATWERYKAIMLQGRLDLRTKEIVALTTSMVNRCSYCIDSHSTALRGMGMSDEELVELTAVIDFFCGTNVFTSGLKIEFK
jgi:AhpD family alkylhydroperoxidase